MKIRKAITILMTLCLLLSVLGPVFPASVTENAQSQQLYADAVEVSAPLSAGEEAQASAQSTGTKKGSPTKVEIRRKWDKVTTATDIFVTEPSVTAPYSIGELSESFLHSGITYLNYVRFVAGLPEVQFSDALNEDAQYGSVLMAANDSMSHHPTRPQDMDEDFYNRGYSATSSSNICTGIGHNPLTCLQASIQAYMDDDEPSNLSRVGHRRWLLNPTLLNIGFGFAQSEAGWWYTATKVFDRSGESFDYDYISWPAANNFPTNLFSTTVPWSITLNPSKYKTPNLSDLTITITRKSDGKTWSFDSSTGSAESSSEAFMEVEISNYGVNNCIIFHPGSKNVDSYEGIFTVDVSGIYYTNGTAATLHYEVDFFDVMSVQEDGWFQAGSDWYYYLDGEAVTGWLELDDTWYYMDESGVMQTGWEKIGHIYFYFNSDGAMATGWLKDNGTWYYLKANGVMATGWQLVNGTYYYFSSSGAMQTGWLKSGNIWYYLRPSGEMATKWWQVGTTWYYFNAGGAMQTGWLKSGNTWYYLQASGAMATGWQQIGSCWYYFTFSGAMVTGTQVINGKTYNFNSNGVWIP